MNAQSAEVRQGIVLFKGRMARNLLLEGMVSNSYFLEDGDEVILFDPSCGREIAKRIEAHIRSRREAKAMWTRAYVVAGHSHTDHASNLYLSEVIGAPESHIYIHERGFREGRVQNEMAAATENMVLESMRYYNLYKVLPSPYSLLTYPLTALDALSPALARKAAGLMSGALAPRPVDGTLRPELLCEDDLQAIDLGNCQLSGWRVGRKVILPTPGHSPCSVSLLWPEQKALFVSDADWIGNPLFISASLRDSLSSMQKLKELTVAGKVDLLLPAHGFVKQGREQVLSYLDFHFRRLEVTRNEVLAAYRSSGEVKDVSKLTRVLVQESPLFRILKLADFPRVVVFVHSVVAVCLREEGILD